MDPKSTKRVHLSSESALEPCSGLDLSTPAANSVSNSCCEATPATPLSPLCSSCASLFHRPDDPSDKADVEHDADKYVYSVEFCSICAFIKRRNSLATLFPGLKMLPGPVLSLDRESDGDISPWVLAHLGPAGSSSRVFKTQVMQFFPSSMELKIPTIKLDPCIHALGRSVVTINPSTTATNTGDEACFDAVRKWRRICEKEHDLCRRAKVHRDLKLPSRLLDVKNGLKVVVTDKRSLGDRCVDYATLSHRWLQEDHVRLLKSNVLEFLVEIDFDSLPKVFQEFIVTARRLDIEYVWIDALCIVQDDAKDWETEAALMGSVYQNAVLNVGASAAACVAPLNPAWIIPGARESFDIPIGLFVSRNTRALGAAHVQIVRRGYKEEHFGFERQLTTDLYSHGPLMQRGWVLQERLLSRCSIYFDEQITWECPELLANEIFPQGAPSRTLINPWNQNSPMRLNAIINKPKLDSLEYGHGIVISDVYRTWLYLIETYRHTRLTFQSDALPALSGLASVFQAHMKDDYLAGLWRKDIMRGLLWNRCLPHCRRILQRPLETYRDLSVDFPHITDVHGTEEELFVAKVIEAKVTTAHLDPTGPVSDGYIVLASFLLVNLSTRSSIDHWDDDMDLARSNGEAYDFEYDANGDDSCEGSFLLVLTHRPKRVNDKAKIRGLILKPHGKDENEYRRVGVFALDPNIRSDFTDFNTGILEKQIVKII